MSEYQYYEFQAIDRPLTDRQMEELRAISTRAEITPTSFVNEYQWGDLKARPIELMKKYFDAHLYVANWGTRRMMLRIPRELIDVDAAREYCNDETLFVHVHRDRVILTFESEDEGCEDWDSGEGWLPSLLPLRTDLMQGDLRSLYLGWLAGAFEEDDEPEAPVPPGLSQLSGPIESLAGFMRIDPDLLETAAKGDGGSPPAGPSPEDVARWVKRLPASEKNGLLSQLLLGEPPASHALGSLRQRFRKDWNEANRSASGPPSGPRRTVAQLFQARDALAEERRRREAKRKAKEQAKREKKAVAERKRYLQQIAAKEDKIWREVESLLRTTNQKDYDRAVQWLKDLRDLAAMSSTDDQWRKRLAELRRRYSRKSSLMKRFNAAGFPS